MYLNYLITYLITLKNDNNSNELLPKSNFSNPQNIIDFDNFKKILRIQNLYITK